MIVQFVESYTSSDRPNADHTGRVVRVDTTQTVTDARICGGSRAVSLVALFATWGKNEVFTATGYACTSLLSEKQGGRQSLDREEALSYFERWSFNNIIATGRIHDRKLEFSDEDLRKMGLAGKLLVEQMLPALMTTKNNKWTVPKKMSGGEYWMDTRNWRVRTRVRT